jgi:predicted nucleotidyltransferase
MVEIDKKLLNILFNYNFINFALLFGSYSNNTQKELSDIDVAIGVDKDIDIFMMGEIIAILEECLGKRVDLVIVNDLYKENSKLAFNITNNHKLIFCRNTKEYIEFKTNSLKYYFDMRYMYEMFDKELLKRLDNGTFGKTKIS